MPGAKIGLGLAALGRPGYINVRHGEDISDRSVEGMERRTHEVLDAAHDRGVRWFDAARSYGRAEEFLASWLALRGLEPGDVTVSSKWGYRYTAGWRVDVAEHEVKDLSVEHLRMQWRETREILGDHVSVYQIHSATLDSGVFDDRAVRDELDELRAGGVRVGFTVTGPQQAATIDHALATGGFDTVQATWNLYERSAEGALERAHEAGLVVLIKEALANGRLVEVGAAEAFAAALARPWADVVLSGASTLEQLEGNLAARELVWNDELERRFSGLAEEPAPYWTTRAELPWT